MCWSHPANCSRNQEAAQRVGTPISLPKNEAKAKEQQSTSGTAQEKNFSGAQIGARHPGEEGYGEIYTARG